MVCLLSGLLGVAVFAKGAAAPAAVPASQAYNWKPVYTGAGGGFIVDVIFHPTQQNLIYVKTDMGGFYRWNQSTGKWIQLMNWVPGDNWNWTGGESMAIDPSDPNKLYLAGGTYTNSWDPSNGVIMRSNDKGNTFAITQMPFKMGGNMPGRGMGERLVVDPNKGSILYFGARDGKGLWKSSDSGVTWSQVANFPATGVYMEDPNDTVYDYGNHAVGIPWVIFDKSTGTTGNATQTIYVGVADGRSAQPNIYVSNNGGSTWAALAGQPICTLSGNITTCTGGTTWDVTALDDSGNPANPSPGLLAKQAVFDSAGTLYVTYSNWAGPYRGSNGDVWKYLPSTGVWTKINPGNAANNYCGMGGQYWGYGGIGVDPQVPGTLVVAAVNSWWPDGQLFRSTDGGATWKCLWNMTSWPTITSQYTLDLTSAPWLAHGYPQKTAPEVSVRLGWMMEALKIDPFNSNKMLYGTGETLYGTTNLKNWDTGGIVTIASMAQGMEETSVGDLISPPASSAARLFSGVGDVGGWRHDSLDTAPGMGYTVPDGAGVTSIDYAEASPSFLARVNFTGSAFTYDNGNNWFKGNANPVAGKGGGTIAAAANASRVVWAANESPVSYSTDNGNSWVAATGGIPNGSIVAADRVNPNKFYGFGGGKFWYSTNGGASFTASAATGLPATSAHIEAVIGREGDVWFTGGTQISGGSTACGNVCGLWHTTDGGITITKISTVDFGAAVGLGKASPTGSGYPAIYLYGRADGGMLTAYRSDDIAATWVRITDDAHNFATIQAITGDPTIYGRVYIGTNGLGMHYGDVAGAQPATSTPTKTFTPGTPATNTPTKTNTPGTVVPTFTVTKTVTKTNTPTPVITNTLTRTATRTNTSTIGPSLTPTRTGTRTLTPVITSTPTKTSTGTRTFTPTVTPTGSIPGCSPVTATITAPFTQDGVGTFCWQSTNLGTYINSWNTTSLTINGVNYTNVWASSGSYPAKIGGFWYVTYNGPYAWSHFEAK